MVQPAFVILGVLGACVALIASGIHAVPEGYCGMYYLGGALMDGINGPGYHIKMPFYSKINVQLTLQTDTVRNIPCGTSTGVMIYFDRIEVVNQLSPDKAHSTIKRFGTEYDKSFIFDKIHHEINQFCSQNSLHEVYIDKFSSLDESLAEALQKSCDEFDTGIKVIAIRVTKPRIPESVSRNYIDVERATSELKVAEREQEVLRKREETERMKQTIAAQRDAEVAVIQAQKDANVTLINTKKMIEVKKGDEEIARIGNAMLLEHQKAHADAAYYSAHREAEGLKEKLSEAYLRYVMFTSLANTTKIYFGEKIPTIFADMLSAQARTLTTVKEDSK